MKNLDHHIRQFLEICRCQSLSEAADKLDMSQSGLSRTLAALETHLGHALFERNGRGVQLTDAGVKLRDAAQPAYDSVDDALEQLKTAQGVTSGALRVATIHTLSYYFMGDVVASFMSQRPAVNISVVGRASPDVVELVASGKAEIGFVYDTAVDTDAVEIIPLFEEEMALVACAASFAAQQASIDLVALDLPLVSFPQHYALRRMLERQGFRPRISAEVETVDAMLKLVSLTGGHCILPDRISTELLSDYGLVRVPLERPALKRRIVAITNKARTRSPLASFILEIALQHKG
ncbi:LysR family transcriptional regulator [Herbaspirillum sp. WKF16]|uniref:LysR family transcriptional regulator n=1 Tax=Herbaspirillum sp. WKF16 TaxID=3028312 RepID=UPI0023A9F696|nr:LysR family transcriptional regulator [Herbaspirillum sp. WKF16]WDZ94858.1 LysR family transcriptional regulator [Herbaspirillum sp. WKF16]